jgi:hypothetical protein
LLAAIHVCRQRRAREPDFARLNFVVLERVAGSWS